MDIDERLQDYAEEVSSPHEPWLAELSEERAARSARGRCSRRGRGAVARDARVGGAAQRMLEIGTSAATRRSRWPPASPPTGISIRASSIPSAPRSRMAHRSQPVGPPDHGSHRAGRRVDRRAPGSFDLVFMDADKTGYIDYYEAVLPRLSERRLIVVDDTLHGGHVFEDGDPSPPSTPMSPRTPQLAGAVDRAGRHDRHSSRLSSFGTHARSSLKRGSMPPSIDADSYCHDAA